MYYPKVLSALFAASFLVCSGQSLAQTAALPYFSGFDTEAQKSNWQQFRKGDINPIYAWEYATTAAYSAPGCLVHNYPVGGTVASDDWFVSPGFILNSGGKLDSLRYAFSGFGVPAAGDTVALYLLSGSADPALATTRSLLYDFRGDNYSNDNTWRLLSNINLPATTGTCYIALRYRTVNNWLDVRFDNLKLRSNSTTGIGEREVRAEAALLYPNPAGERLWFRTSEAFTQTSICDISGKTVFRGRFRTELDISGFAPGAYSVSCSLENGAKWSHTFIKQ